jgi:Xaa-Pro aminopeptidase
MFWLDQQIKDIVHTEVSLADKLTEFRSQNEYFQGLSFGTIVGYQANSAVGHYCPKPDTTPNIKPVGILLIDSGGQYLDGTTDITRTITLGSPTYKEKFVYTLVLRGLIKLTRAIFPKGTKGNQLDTLAREPLWQGGYNCRHGIGHGVGSFLNVHEGPQRLSTGNCVSLKKGMLVTIEPGVYFEGRYGIRLENVVITVAKETTEFGEFYGFETITLCPFDLDLIDFSVLRSEERNWLNEYHTLVFKTLAPFLTQSEKAWLRDETRQI